MLILTSAIYILNCTDVNISNSVLSMSDGTGISIYDTNGQVVIESTDILKSFVRNANSDFLVGGGGLFIEFTKCTPGGMSYNNCIHDEGHNTNAIYTIRNCNFSHNIVNASKHFSNVWYRSGISGGGVYIVFKSNATNTSVTFFRCTLHSNYAPHSGGGMKVLFQDSAQNNKVSLINTVFMYNSVSFEDAIGGGLQIIFDFYQDNEFPNNNIVNLTSCDFKNNTAYSGGGVSVILTQIPVQDTDSAIYFSNCTWTGNTALYGAAVHIAPGIWATQKNGHFPLLVFSNTIISSNKVIPTVSTETHRMVPLVDTDQGLQTQINGAGAFFSTQINIVFAKMTKFISNNGTALYLSSCIAKFKASSQVVFDSNNGTNGGAIALLGQSFLLPQSPSTFSFTNNTARQLGGGIYFQSTIQNVQQPCFIFHSINSNFTFISNRAGSGQGHHIFVSSFTSCNAFCDREFIYDCIGNFFFYDPHNQTDSTATLPAQFSLNTTGPFMIFPGLSHYH